MVNIIHRSEPPHFLSNLFFGITIYCASRCSSDLRIFDSKILEEAWKHQFISVELALRSKPVLDWSFIFTPILRIAGNLFF
jgi:hypothetical protein